VRENYTKTTIVNDLSCKFTNANDLFRSAFFLVQNFAQMQEKEREFLYYKIVNPFLKKKIAVFRDVLKGFCHFVT